VVAAGGELIDIPGLATRAAESDNAAWTLSVGGEFGLNVDLGEHTTLQPFAGVSWGQYWGEGYTETGADSLDLTVGSQSANEWQPTAGARIMHASRSGSDIVTPFVGAAFLGQIPVGAGWAPVYTSDFNLDVPTQVDTAPLDRYGVNVQLGIELASIKGMTAFVAFDGAWLTGKQRYGGQIGVFVPF
jgi:outer membrane autotransporter protein